jgi:hypothetical protein
MFAVLKMPSAFAFFEEAKTKDVKHVSVPEVVPDCMENLGKCWSEWQDLNLRPPRPERGSGPAEFASAFASELLSTGQDEEGSWQQFSSENA